MCNATPTADANKVHARAEYMWTEGGSLGMLLAAAEQEAELDYRAELPVTRASSDTRKVDSEQPGHKGERN